MKKNLVINILLLITINSSLNGGFIEWAKCPWTWAGLTLSAATVQLGYWAYLSKKKETVATQIDRARHTLKLENEKSAQTLHGLRTELSTAQLISQEAECITIMRRIGYPYDEEFAKDLQLINVTPSKSPLNKPRIKAVEKHLHRILGNPTKQIAGSAPHVANPNKRHKQQIKTLAWGTATVTCAIAAGECFTQSCQ
jgi:Tfp pilus assembly protein PilO